MPQTESIWALPVRKLTKLGILNNHPHNKHRNGSLQQSYVSFISIINVFIVLLHLFEPCSAVIYKFPVKQRRQPVSQSRNGSGVGESLMHVFRREASSSDDLTSMRNNLVGLSGNGYYIDVDIGTPPQRMQVLIDTGSANFAVASEHDPNLSHYFHEENSSSFSSSGVEIYVPYTEGEWRGFLGTDIVTLPSALNLSATVNIACITESKSFFISDAQWQGILGLAYTELSRPDSSYLPFWDTLLMENLDVSNVFSIQLCGSSFVHTRDKPLMEGTLIIGGVLPSLSKSPLFYTPIYKQWYYEVVLTDVHVDGLSLGLDCKEYNFDKTIVDSGTTNIRLPQKVFDATVQIIDSYVQGQHIGPYFYTGSDVACYADMVVPFSVFPVVSFFLLESENTSFRLDITAQHYLRPVENIQGGGVLPNQSCVKFGFSPSASGTVLGAVLMEAFYVVFDRNTSKIGFGQTTCPLPDPAHQILERTISGPFSSNKNLNECAYKKPDSGEARYLVISYVMAGLLVVVLLPMLLLFAMWTCKLVRRRRRRGDSSESQAVLSGS
ncbi:unnamed protein product [Candidula unifasciata]|uniref:Peptidase A1 domain-containing protein n=1 Tax=Candidula unifasciata TaxID=100452 RepID=A0A8S3YM65_9EUPU|nr:unnamed protein product [Candidula unifasciata]